MNAFQYLILANAYFAIFGGFYALFLRKETFFQLNRVYLLSASLLSFVLPAIQSGWAERLDVTRQLKTIYLKPVNVFASPGHSSGQWSYMEIAPTVYFIGVVVFSLLLLARLIKVKKFMTMPRLNESWSFFRKIHLGSTAGPVIDAHEKVHAQQWHSFDVLLIEVIAVVNWFNPMVYFFRKELKNLHEFIADEGALRLTASKREYAMLLFNQTFETPINSLVSPFFSQKLLKRRIMMIQKNRSGRTALLKYGLSIPLLAITLVLSSATTSVPATVVITDENPQHTKKQSNEPVFTAVEHEPNFPGGMNKFYEFLSHTIKYPAQMKAKKVQGRVFISFIVEKDGSLTAFKILRDVGYGSGKEAVRALSLSPKWNPGVQDRHKVRVQYNVPINFAIEDAKAN